MLLSCGDALIDFLPAKSADGRDTPYHGPWLMLGRPRAAHADIMRLSDGEFAFLYGAGGHQRRKAEALLTAGAGLIAVTRGIRGVQAWHGRAGAVEVATPRVDVVDTVRAGDSLQAALLFALGAMSRIGSASSPE